MGQPCAFRLSPTRPRLEEVGTQSGCFPCQTVAILTPALPQLRTLSAVSIELREVGSVVETVHSGESPSTMVLAAISFLCVAHASSMRRSGSTLSSTTILGAEISEGGASTNMTLGAAGTSSTEVTPRTLVRSFSHEFSTHPGRCAPVIHSETQRVTSGLMVCSLISSGLLGGTFPLRVSVRCFIKQNIDLCLKWASNVTFTYWSPDSRV